MLTIGLPVYNGASRGLQKSIESVLAQSYGDFVLVVSDNGSTDATKDIVQALAKTDKRILYLPSEVNVGAIENFKRCLYVACTPYFMWMADDDRQEPTYISKCLRALQASQDSVLAHSLVQRDGAVAEYIKLDQDHAAFRFIKCFGELPNCYPFYGVWRTSVLRLLNWKDLLWGFDFVALCESTLYGKWQLVEEPLFNVGHASLWSKPVHEHVKHYAGMMDTRKSGVVGGVTRDGRGLTMPIVEKVLACFEVLNYATLSSAEKEQVMEMMLLAKERYMPFMQLELDRVREKTCGNRERSGIADGWLLDGAKGGNPSGALLDYHVTMVRQRLEGAEFLGLDVTGLM